ncbi:MAG: hypothetical protein V4488_24980 [Pseudomonadota bacterium]
MLIFTSSAQTGKNQGYKKKHTLKQGFASLMPGTVWTLLFVSGECAALPLQ